MPRRLCPRSKSELLPAKPRRRKDGAHVADSVRCALCGLDQDASGIEGKLLGPLKPKPPAKKPIYVHEECVRFSAECQGRNEIDELLVGSVVRRGNSIRCSVCGQPGGTITCAYRSPRTCWTYYHLRCALKVGAAVCKRRRQVFCCLHRKDAEECGFFRGSELATLDVPASANLLVQLEAVKGRAVRRDASPYGCIDASVSTAKDRQHLAAKRRDETASAPPESTKASSERSARRAPSQRRLKRGNGAADVENAQAVSTHSWTSRGRQSGARDWKQIEHNDSRDALQVYNEHGMDTGHAVQTATGRKQYRHRHTGLATATPAVPSPANRGPAWKRHPQRKSRVCREVSQIIGSLAAPASWYSQTPLMQQNTCDDASTKRKRLIMKKMHTDAALVQRAPEVSPENMEHQGERLRPLATYNPDKQPRSGGDGGKRSDLQLHSPSLAIETVPLRARRPTKSRKRRPDACPDTHLVNTASRRRLQQQDAVTSPERAHLASALTSSPAASNESAVKDFAELRASCASECTIEPSYGARTGQSRNVSRCSVPVEVYDREVTTHTGPSGAGGGASGDSKNALSSRQGGHSVGQETGASQVSAVMRLNFSRKLQQHGGVRFGRGESANGERASRQVPQDTALQTPRGSVVAQVQFRGDDALGKRNSVTGRQRKRRHHSEATTEQENYRLWELTRELQFGDREPLSWVTFAERTLEALERSRLHSRPDGTKRAKRVSAVTTDALMTASTPSEGTSLVQMSLSAAAATETAPAAGSQVTASESNVPGKPGSLFVAPCRTPSERIDSGCHDRSVVHDERAQLEYQTNAQVMGVLDWEVPPQPQVDPLIPCRILIPLERDVCALCHGTVDESGASALFCWLCGEAYHAECQHQEQQYESSSGRLHLLDLGPIRVIPNCTSCAVSIPLPSVPEAESSCHPADRQGTPTESSIERSEQVLWNTGTEHNDSEVPLEVDHSMQAPCMDNEAVPDSSAFGAVKRRPPVSFAAAGAASFAASRRITGGGGSERVPYPEVDTPGRALPLPRNSYRAGVEQEAGTYAAVASKNTGQYASESNAWKRDSMQVLQRGEPSSVQEPPWLLTLSSVPCVVCGRRLDSGHGGAMPLLLCGDCEAAAAAAAATSNATSTLPGDQVKRQHVPGTLATTGPACSRSPKVSSSSGQGRVSEAPVLACNADAMESECADPLRDCLAGTRLPYVSCEAQLPLGACALTSVQDGAFASHLAPGTRIEGTERTPLVMKQENSFEAEHLHSQNSVYIDAHMMLANSEAETGVQENTVRLMGNDTSLSQYGTRDPVPEGTVCRALGQRVSASFGVQAPHATPDALQAEHLVWSRLCAVPDCRRCALCACPERGESAQLGCLVPLRLSESTLRWLHMGCLALSTQTGAGLSRTIQAALSRKCSVCRRTGASVFCSFLGCTQVFHVRCVATHANAAGADAMWECSDHRSLCWCWKHRSLLGREATAGLAPSGWSFPFSSMGHSLPSDVRGLSLNARPALRVGAWTLLDYGALDCTSLEATEAQWRLPPDCYIARRFWSMIRPFERTLYFISCTADVAHEPRYSLCALDAPHDRLSGVCITALWHQMISRVLRLWAARLPVRLAHLFTKCIAERSTEERQALAERFFCPVPVLVQHLATSMLASVPADTSPDHDVGGASPTARSAGAARCSLYLRPSNESKWSKLAPVHRSLEVFERAVAGAAYDPLHAQRSAASGIPGSAERACSALRSRPEQDRVPPRRGAWRVVSATATDRRLYRQMQLEHRKYCVPLRSRIHGFGLFARCDLQADQMIVEYAGERIASPVADVRERHYERRGIGCYMFRIDADWVIDATMIGSVARYINHSCRPNCYSEILRISDEPKQDVIVIRSARAIKRGEELTYNYMFDVDNAMKIPCLCGEPGCVGFMN
jgi:hypothetical protein